jgi:hypothetical protein
MLVKEPDPLNSTILKKRNGIFLNQNNFKKCIQSGNFTIVNEKKKNIIQNVLKLNIKTLKPIIISMNTNKYYKARLICLFSDPANFTILVFSLQLIFLISLFSDSKMQDKAKETLSSIQDEKAKRRAERNN